ncbi:hypothetical protein [Couchioplanes caeruleus]|uniref:Uncharacterized protein n=2 Tax=Couchioplanes caeruleus TaxID=56438 RepID=A0A1K0GKL5_9ACTN|nr:hypothetical protein [Couchioplanes caeruleus]OJF09731.1 hypothetical protein BG844_35950 [Couchioplanes caeruleus subsp. caeruleus]ROP28734.1 hypothetical protein EDD30_1506 [Couchioplanes caeruleus]
MTTTDPAAQRTISRWGDTAVGAAFEAEAAATRLIRDLRRVTEQRRRQLAELAARGAAERARYRRRTAEAAEAAVTAVATSPLVDHIVDNQLQRVLRPVVHAVLDDVLLLLEKEPDRIRTLIRGQRESMVDELVGRLRTGAEAGDTAVDRLTFRMFHHPGPKPEPPVDL